MKKLRVAVIGAGYWAQNHLNKLKELEQTELVAVCDPNFEKAAASAQKYKITPFSNSEEMLVKEDIDAVTICTWSTELAKETLKALNAGKHVLVEKPMAITIKEAEEVENEVAKRNLF